MGPGGFTIALAAVVEPQGLRQVSPVEIHLQTKGSVSMLLRQRQNATAGLSADEEDRRGRKPGGWCTTRQEEEDDDDDEEEDATENGHSTRLEQTRCVPPGPQINMPACVLYELVC